MTAEQTAEAVRRLWLAEEERRTASPSQFYVMGRQDWPVEDRYHYSFHRSPHRIRALFLGNGSGKTSAAAIEANWWLQHQHPYQIDVNSIVDVRVLWICQTFKQMDMLQTQLETECLSKGWRYDGTKHQYIWEKLRSKLTVFSNDGDWSSVQGVPVDLVIIDEECDGRLWRELQMRRRARKQTRYVISATATQGRRWMYQEVYVPWLDHHKRLGLDESQAMRVQSHPRIWCWPQGGIDDNPGRREGDEQNYIDVLAMASPAERQVRLKGGFQDFNAAPVFDLQVLDKMERVNEEQHITGVGVWLRPKDGREEETICTVGDSDPTGRGRVTIYEKPVDDYYVMGADFAYGLESGDYDACVVIRQSTGRQVAVAEGRWGDATFANVLRDLGYYYGEALLVGERQVGLPTLRRLYDELGYRRIYWEKDETHKSPRHSDLLGHHASAGDMVIPRLKMALGDPGGAVIRLSDPATIHQFRKYEWRPRSKRVELTEARNQELSHAAPRGEHDDLVMATAYAYKGLMVLPQWPKDEVLYKPGSAGDILDHAGVQKSFEERKSRNPFE